MDYPCHLRLLAEFSQTEKAFSQEVNQEEWETIKEVSIGDRRGVEVGSRWGQEDFFLDKGWRDIVNQLILREWRNNGGEFSQVYRDPRRTDCDQ